MIQFVQNEDRQYFQFLFNFLTVVSKKKYNYYFLLILQLCSSKIVLQDKFCSAHILPDSTQNILGVARTLFPRNANEVQVQNDPLSLIEMQEIAKDKPSVETCEQPSSSAVVQAKL